MEKQSGNYEVAEQVRTELCFVLICIHHLYYFEGQYGAVLTLEMFKYLVVVYGGYEELF